MTLSARRTTIKQRECPTCGRTDLMPRKGFHYWRGERCPTGNDALVTREYVAVDALLSEEALEAGYRSPGRHSRTSTRGILRAAVDAAKGERE